MFHILRWQVFACVVLSSVLILQSARAQDDCEPSRRLDAFELAKPISQPAPGYPKDELNQTGEGWTLFEYSISPDGIPTNIVVRDRVGGPKFLAASRDALARSRYTAPKLAGRPVTEHRRLAQYDFRFEGPMAAYKDVVISRYKRARRFLEANDPKSAITELDFALKFAMTNYERAMTSFLLAYAHFLEKDFSTAVGHIRHALVSHGKYLNNDSLPEALALGVVLEFEDGNYREAMCQSQWLQQVAPNKAVEAPQGEIAEDIRSLIQSAAPIVISAKVSRGLAEGSTEVWRHPMLRERFSFAAPISAALSFRLVCRTAVVEGIVGAGKLWTLPPGSGDCELQVYGPAGATFELIESR